AEDVDEDPPDVGVTSDDLEGRRDVLLGGAAADVEEVRRLAADLLDRVHRRHGQTGAVDEAADVAVELDERQAVLPGLDLGRDLLAEVAQRGDLGVRSE